MNNNWYIVDNAADIDSPALLVYPQRVTENIEAAIQIAGNPVRLMPHGKTHKTREGFEAMIHHGIRRFKCATIVETELACTAGASQVVLSYQPVGPKTWRLLGLAQRFPETTLACLIDDLGAATTLNNTCGEVGMTIGVYIDLNIGMNRTGIRIDDARYFYDQLENLGNLRFLGLHAYDGHIRDSDFAERKDASDRAFAPVNALRHEIEQQREQPIELIAGGSPTFPVHAGYPDRVCSPGTFIFWDRGYELTCPDQPFKPAIALLCRVISKPSPGLICIDLGHKAVAAENDITKRVYLPDHPHAVAISQSEEHLVLQTNDDLQVGDVVYGIPYHVCPTVALHDAMLTVNDNRADGSWEVIRGR